MRHALIFGAGGFVGRYLTAELAAHGYEVSGADVLPTLEFDGLASYQRLDLTDCESVRGVIASLAPDAIVNLAAVSSVGASWSIPAQTFQVNVGGTLNILEAIRALGLTSRTKVLLIGSSEEYSPSTGPLRETDPLDATNPYGVSKANQGRIADLYSRSFGLGIVRTRSFNHTGPGQTDRFVLPSFCRQAADIVRGIHPPVIRVGNLGVERDFSDVRDVVRAYRTLLESDACVGETFNVGSGSAHSLRSLLETILSFTGRDVEIETNQSLIRPTDNPHVEADISKIARVGGWRPERSLDDTLYEMFEAFVSRSS